MQPDHPPEPPADDALDRKPDSPHFAGLFAEGLVTRGPSVPGQPRVDITVDNRTDHLLQVTGALTQDGDGVVRGRITLTEAEPARRPADTAQIDKDDDDDDDYSEHGSLPDDDDTADVGFWLYEAETLTRSIELARELIRRGEAPSSVASTAIAILRELSDLARAESDRRDNGASR